MFTIAEAWQSWLRTTKLSTTLQFNIQSRLPLGSKLDYSYFTWPKYHYILRSLASNSPLTCPTISLESHKTLMDLSPSFLTKFRPALRTLYSTSLFMVEKSNLKNYSMVMCSREIMITLILKSLWLAAPSMYNSQHGWGDAKTVITSLSILPCSSLPSPLLL